MATSQELLDFAQGEVGYSRWGDPEQGTKYGRYYAELTGSPWFGTNGVPYCAMFVTYCLSKLGIQCDGFPRAVAIDRRDGLARQVEPFDLIPGDVIGFDWDGDNTGDHVGFFKEWIQPRYSFRTIEGNTGDGEVLECTRYVTQLTIGVRPYYDDASNPASEAGFLEVDGIAGPHTVTVWQQQLGLIDDGVISDQLPEHDCYRTNVWAVEHGEGGSPLVREVQRRCGLTGVMVDGDWGKETSKAIQRKLEEWGYYGGGIDGDFGHHSVMALQRSINDRRW